MALKHLFSSTYYLFLYMNLAILVAGCATPAPSLKQGENEKYFFTWEPEHSGKYRLAWYYNRLEDRKKNQPNTVLAHTKKFIVFPEVKPPMLNAIYLLEYSRVYEGEEVLDLGTGTGIHAVFAAEKAKRVVATDIFAPAVENARVNARQHGVDHKIDFRVGDLFEPIKDGEKFDVFFININFPSKMDDYRNSLHERIFSEIGQYMKPNARIYFQTSFVRNMPFIYDMLKRHNFRIMELRMEHMESISHEPMLLMIQRP